MLIGSRREPTVRLVEMPLLPPMDAWQSSAGWHVAATAVSTSSVSQATAISLEDVEKRYPGGREGVLALSHLSLTVPAGEFVSIMGVSGSGKSTLLNIIAGLEAPTKGRVIVEGQDLSELTEVARSEVRLRTIGIVFQSFHLFPNFTAEENVGWRLRFQGVPWRETLDRTRAMLEEVGIARATGDRLPAELSGGEQQRVAIARALITAPRLLLADEPTGNLDSSTAEAILGLLRKLNVGRRLTIVMVTHSAYAATCGHRTIELRDGRIECDVRAPREPGARVIPIRD
jgi:putative ABC transport system ATP-binding protein